MTSPEEIAAACRRGAFLSGLAASSWPPRCARCWPAVPARAATPGLLKALIVPHAGYRYSGPVAASAYALLRRRRDTIRRVVLLGPVHRVPIRGLALPSAQAFETPLGRLPIDREAVSQLLALRQVSVSRAAHAQEHSLEVQLPFLQEVLGKFSLVPLAVGDASPEEVAEVIELLWGGPETLIVVSSDLSHFLPYERARRLDADTCATITQPDSQRQPRGSLRRYADQRPDARRAPSSSRADASRPAQLRRHRRRSRPGGGLRRLRLPRGGAACRD